MGSRSMKAAVMNNVQTNHKGGITLRFPSGSYHKSLSAASLAAAAHSITQSMQKKSSFFDRAYLEFMLNTDFVFLYVLNLVYG